MHELDRRVGHRRRSSFIAGAVRQALDEERRWDLIESSLGAIGDTGHEWDPDARGRTVAQADALIAAAAHALGATIATGNVKDFPARQPPLDGLQVEHRPAGG